MSGKLDQGLDEIISTQRRAAGGRRQSQRRSTGGRPVTTAPIGGVKKTTRPPKGPANKQVPAKAIGANGESKVVVSNLPKDVNEAQIKEYFNSSVGSVKRVEVSYGPGGVSRGIATITFSKVDGASKAFKALNGLLVDNRPIKIEIVVTGDKAAAIVPTAKSLTDRVSQPKAQPKSAANNKKKDAAGKAGGSDTRPARGRAQKKNARPAKKTADELDSEMADYFVANGQSNDNATAAAPAAVSGDAAMADEIL
ncbi:THO complex subunit 4 [Microdochium nivale]|nr:THO complex subunit 4 [Microdochium nivale]